MLEVRIVFFTIFAISLVTSSPVIHSHRALQNSIRSPGQAALDVKTTIEEVQRMLEMDPNLPRLTRGEIEDLFEQVTREEYEKSLKVGDFTRAKHMRALMLVLPYNTESGSSDNLQEIYNRPPVTKVVSSTELKAQKPQKIIVPSGRVEIISVDKINPTTYKPSLRQTSYTVKQPVPTTYRPNPQVMKTATTTEPTIFVTTTPTVFHQDTYKNPSSSNNRFSSHYSAKKTDFNKDAVFAPKINEKPKITSDLEEILESLGFAAQTQSRKRFKLEEPEDDLPKPILSSLIKQDRISVDEYEPEPETLTVDDFRKSLTPEIKPEDYVAFKPLPIPRESPKNIQPELEDYLKMFGIIGENGGRSQKSLKLSENQEQTAGSTSPTTTTPVTTTPSYARIKRIDTDFEEQDSEPVAPVTTDQSIIDQEDYIQLQRLLNNIRELQKLNITLNDDDSFKKLDLNNYNFSETLLSQGPDPIESVDTDDPLKNEIKRQSDNAEPTRFKLELSLDTENDTFPISDDLLSIAEEIPSSTEPTTSTTSTTTTTTTTTEATRRGGSSGLDDDTFSGLDPVTEEPLPKPRKNGFYFLADWNSFLEVGDGDEQVVVRFNPKVGDPSRFIPVTVP